ncbi:hypothetical protein OH768_52635 [Streptomyces sp. NBC_01622]|uniref:hypothetical protein n=1 Tax=Streptomyces sp. NBC_01622 TaxID=2975903 RepID=UPI003866DE8B|nr:hypothetical protein OH768_52635 [Streptomyces sp. NBC_01622]
MTLEQRLLALAEGLGADVCAWLFAETVRPWAFVTARMRNVLSHGFAASDGVREEPGALAGALRLTEVVITLRLVTDAGLPYGADLLARLDRHRGLRSLSKQTVANWYALARRISPQQWAPPDPGPQPATGNAEALEEGTTDPTPPVPPA